MSSEQVRELQEQLELSKEIEEELEIALRTAEDKNDALEKKLISLQDRLDDMHANSSNSIDNLERALERAEAAESNFAK